MLLARVKELLKLLNAGSDIFPEMLKGILYEKDESGLNALHHAIRSGNKIAVQWCMQNGAVAHTKPYSWRVEAKFESPDFFGTTAQNCDIKMSDQNTAGVADDPPCGQTLAYSWYDFEQDNVPEPTPDQNVEYIGSIKSVIPDGASKMTLATLWEYVLHCMESHHKTDTASLCLQVPRVAHYV